MTPNRFGIIKFTALGGELVQGFGMQAFGTSGFGAPNETYAAGEEAIVALKDYISLSKQVTDLMMVNRASRGNQEILHFGIVEKHAIEQAGLTDVEAAGVNSEVAVFKSMMESGAKGQVLTWYPDIQNYPAEFRTCTLRIVPPIKRISTAKKLFEVTMTLEEVETTALPSLPVFV